MGLKKRRKYPDPGPPHRHEEIGFGISPTLWATSGAGLDYVFPTHCKKCGDGIVVPKPIRADVESGKRVPLCPQCLKAHVAAAMKAGVWQSRTEKPSPEFIAFVNDMLRKGPPQFNAQNN